MSLLVVVYISHCEGGNSTDLCNAATLKVFDDVGIYVETNCKMFDTLTVANAKDLGPIFGVLSCVNENYDPSVQCYDDLSWCYGPNKGQIFESLFVSIDKAVMSMKVTGQGLTIQQAHWQYSAQNIAHGTLFLSSIIADETRSNTNKLLLSQIMSGRWAELNFFELNNVCDGGKDIYNYLEGEKRSNRYNKDKLVMAE